MSLCGLLGLGRVGFTRHFLHLLGFLLDSVGLIAAHFQRNSILMLSTIVLGGGVHRWVIGPQFFHGKCGELGLHLRMIKKFSFELSAFLDIDFCISLSVLV